MLIFLLLFSGPKTFDLSKLEMYANSSYSACSIGDDLYLASDGDHLIVRLDHASAVSARFDQHGEGPFELDHPVIIGFSNDELIVLNRRNNLLFFNKDLSVKRKHLLPSKDTLIQGVQLKTNLFAFSTLNYSQSKCIKLMEIKGQELITTSLYGEVTGDFAHKEIYTRGSLDNMEYFIFKPYLDKDNSYEVKVFEFDAHRDEMNMALQSDISAIMESEKHIVLGCIVHLKNGYMVTLEKTNSHYNLEVTIVDRFNAQGSFVKREINKNSLFLVPILNSDEDLMIDRDNLKATFIQP